MFGVAVRLAIGITCSALLFTEALGEGLPTYVLMLAMLMSAVWKWVYRFVLLVTGASAVATRNKFTEPDEPDVSDHIEEKIRQAALQQNLPASDENIRIKLVQQPIAASVAFGKRK